jgi:hypothetical protein
MLADWINQALKHGNVTQAELSRQLQARGLRTVDKSAVNKILKGQRGMTAEEMLAISAITKFPIPGEKPTTQPMREATIAEVASEKAEQSHWSEHVVSESRLRPLMATFFGLLRPQGMTPVLADNLAAAMLLVCRRPPDQQDSKADEDQILAQARALMTLFVPEPFQ